MQRRLRTAASIAHSPSLLAASVSQHTAPERSILCVAAIDAELEVCCESGAKLRTNYGPTTTTTAALSAPRRSTIVTGEQWFTRDNRAGPIWGSRGREFKSRQPDVYNYRGEEGYCANEVAGARHTSWGPGSGWVALPSSVRSSGYKLICKIT